MFRHAERDALADWLRAWRHATPVVKPSLLLAVPRVAPRAKAELFANLLPYALSGSTHAGIAGNDLTRDGAVLSTARSDDGTGRSGGSDALAAVAAGQDGTAGPQLQWDMLEYLKHTLIAALVTELLHEGRPASPLQSTGAHTYVAAPHAAFQPQPPMQSASIRQSQRARWAPTWRRRSVAALGEDRGAEDGVELLNTEECTLAREVIISGLIARYLRLLSHPLVTTLVEEHVDDSVPPDAFGNPAVRSITVPHVDDVAAAAMTAWPVLLQMLSAIALFGRPFRETLIELGVCDTCAAVHHACTRAQNGLGQGTARLDTMCSIADIDNQIIVIRHALGGLVRSLGPCSDSQRCACCPPAGPILGVNKHLRPAVRQLHRLIVADSDAQNAALHGGLVLQASSTPSHAEAAVAETHVETDSESSSDSEVEQVVAPVKAPSFRLPPLQLQRDSAPEATISVQSGTPSATPAADAAGRSLPLTSRKLSQGSIAAPAPPAPMLSPTARAARLVKSMSFRGDVPNPDWSVQWPALHYASPAAAAAALASVGVESARSGPSSTEDNRALSAISTAEGSTDIKPGDSVLDAPAGAASNAGDSGSASGSVARSTPRITPRITPQVRDEDLRLTAAQLRERVRQEVRSSSSLTRANSGLSNARGATPRTQDALTDAGSETQGSQHPSQPSRGRSVPPMSSKRRSLTVAVTTPRQQSLPPPSVRHDVVAQTPAVQLRMKAMQQAKRRRSVGSDISWAKSKATSEPTSYAWLPSTTVLDAELLANLRDLLGEPDVETAKIVMHAPLHLAGDDLKAYVEAKQQQARRPSLGQGSIRSSDAPLSARRGNESARSNEGGRMMVEQFMDELKERNEIIEAVPVAVISRRRLSGMGLESLQIPTSLLSPTAQNAVTSPALHRVPASSAAEPSIATSFTTLASSQDGAHTVSDARDGRASMSASVMSEPAAADGQGATIDDAVPMDNAAGVHEKLDGAPELAPPTAPQPVVDDSTFIFIAKTLRLPYKPAMEALIAKSIPRMARTPRLTATDDVEEDAMAETSIVSSLTARLQQRHWMPSGPRSVSPREFAYLNEVIEGQAASAVVSDEAPRAEAPRSLMRVHNRNSHIPGIGLSPQRPMSKPQVGRDTIFSKQDSIADRRRPVARRASTIREARRLRRGDADSSSPHSPTRGSVSSPKTSPRSAPLATYQLSSQCDAAVARLQQLMKPRAVITGDASRMLAAGVIAPFSTGLQPQAVEPTGAVAHAGPNSSRWITVFPGADVIAQAQLCAAVEGGMIPVRPSGTPIPIGVDESFSHSTGGGSSAAHSPSGAAALDLTASGVARHVQTTAQNSSITTRDDFDIALHHQHSMSGSPRLVLLPDKPVNTVVPRVREVDVPIGAMFVPAILRMGAHDATKQPSDVAHQDRSARRGPGLLYSGRQRRLSARSHRHALDSDATTNAFLHESTLLGARQRADAAGDVPGSRPALVPQHLHRHRALVADMLADAAERHKVLVSRSPRAAVHPRPRKTLTQRLLNKVASFRLDDQVIPPTHQHVAE